MPIGLLFNIPARLVLGLIISALIGLLAYRRGSLSQSGVLGAVITGTLIFGFGGWAAGLTLIAFFVSSSLLSHFKKNNVRKQRAAEMFDKGGQRDLGQALANGGGAALFAIAFGLSVPDVVVWLQGSVPAIVAGMVGALATVTADTWATELGVLSKSKPRLVTTFKHVEPGTSGGVSAVGLSAALAGSIFVTIVFFWLFMQEVGANDRFGSVRLLGSLARPFAYGYWLLGIIIGGVAGSLFDSFLGATVQAMYYSEQRQKETERPFEKDGTPNRPIRGWRWLNNDWVNFIASLFGAAVAAGIALVLTR
jgi:uncharacterized protein (TIGR00297 family)